MKDKVLKVFIIILASGLLCSAFSCKKSTTEDKKIFSDDFNRTNGHPGTNYTLYLPNASTFSIATNQLYPIFTSAAPVAYYINKPTSNHYTSAKFSISGGTFTGVGYVVARAQATDSSTNSYLCGYNGGYLQLGKMVNGSYSAFASVGLHVLTTGVADTITFTLEGASLKCGLAGGSTVSVSVVDSTFADGYDGLTGGGVGANFLYIDDLLIQKL